MQFIGEGEFVVVPNVQGSPTAHGFVEVVQCYFLCRCDFLELLIHGFLSGWDAVSAAGIGCCCEDDGGIGAGCGDIGEEFHHGGRVHLGVEFAIIGFVRTEREDENIGFEVGDLLYGLWGFVDEVGKLGTYNTAMVIHYASLILGNDFESIECIMVLIWGV